MRFPKPKLASFFLRPDHTLNMHQSIKARLSEFFERILCRRKRFSERQVMNRDPFGLRVPGWRLPLFYRVVSLWHYDAKVNDRRRKRKPERERANRGA